MPKASWIIPTKSQKKRAGALVSAVKSSQVAVVDKANGERFLLVAISTIVVHINLHCMKSNFIILFLSILLVRISGEEYFNRGDFS
ncbi:hypothetical protein Tco_1363850 [Tanacetum coccineum]